MRVPVLLGIHASIASIKRVVVAVILCGFSITALKTPGGQIEEFKNNNLLFNNYRIDNTLGNICRLLHLLIMVSSW